VTVGVNETPCTAVCELPFELLRAFRFVAAEAVGKPQFDNQLKADIISAMATELNETHFQAEVLDSQLPVLVDFWSEQCGPCKQLAPVLDQLSEDMDGKAKIFKIDAVANMKLAVSYGVRSVPNLLFFKNGEVKDQFIGALITKDQLKARLEALM
jgi:thioredoxin 1